MMLSQQHGNMAHSSFKEQMPPALDSTPVRSCCQHLQHPTLAARAVWQAGSASSVARHTTVALCTADADASFIQPSAQTLSGNADNPSSILSLESSRLLLTQAPHEG